MRNGFCGMSQSGSECAGSTTFWVFTKVMEHKSNAISTGLLAILWSIEKRVMKVMCKNKIINSVKRGDLYLLMQNYI
jgi:hypothetical protein